MMRIDQITIAICLILATCIAATASHRPPQNQIEPNGKRIYYLYVTAESEDEVSVIRFDGQKATAWKTIEVGELPADIEGPHGLAIDPDGKHWYLSIAHGRPFGYVYKYSTATNKVVGKVTLGMFPATMQISKSTGLLYVVNFNLHGKMKPSSVSVVDPEEMREVARITTGVMPHGSRLSPDGKHHYSCAMMTGELFEIDAEEFKIKRKLNLDHMLGYKMHKKPKSKSKPEAQAKKKQSKPEAQAKKKLYKPEAQAKKKQNPKSKPEAQAKKKHMHMHSKTKPTWVFPHPDGSRVYVACNGSDEVVEVGLKKWKITRRFKTGKGPYNVEIAPNGKTMAVTYKTAAMTAFWDLPTAKELARIKNTRKVSHGVVFSPDSRYAFVSVEGIGGEPGSVDVFDVAKRQLVSSANIGKQAGGIYFWKIDSK